MNSRWCVFISIFLVLGGEFGWLGAMEGEGSLLLQEAQRLGPTLKPAWARSTYGERINELAPGNINDVKAVGVVGAHATSSVLANQSGKVDPCAVQDGYLDNKSSVSQLLALLKAGGVQKAQHMLFLRKPENMHELVKSYLTLEPVRNVTAGLKKVKSWFGYSSHLGENEIDRTFLVDLKNKDWKETALAIELAKEAGYKVRCDDPAVKSILENDIAKGENLARAAALCKVVEEDKAGVQWYEKLLQKALSDAVGTSQHEIVRGLIENFESCSASVVCNFVLDGIDRNYLARLFRIQNKSMVEFLLQRCPDWPQVHYLKKVELACYQKWKGESRAQKSKRLKVVYDSLTFLDDSFFLKFAQRFVAEAPGLFVTWIMNRFSVSGLSEDGPSKEQDSSGIAIELSNEHTTLLKKLFEAIDVNVADFRGNSFLHSLWRDEFTEYGALRAKITQIWIDQKGLDVNKQNMLGETLLHKVLKLVKYVDQPEVEDIGACYEGIKQIVKLLLDKNANLHLEDCQGKMPFEKIDLDFLTQGWKEYQDRRYQSQLDYALKVIEPLQEALAQDLTNQDFKDRIINFIVQYSVLSPEVFTELFAKLIAKDSKIAEYFHRSFIKRMVSLLDVSCWESLQTQYYDLWVAVTKMSKNHQGVVALEGTSFLELVPLYSFYCDKARDSAFKSWLQDCKKVYKMDFNAKNKEGETVLSRILSMHGNDAEIVGCTLQEPSLDLSMKYRDDYSLVEHIIFNREQWPKVSDEVIELLINDKRLTLTACSNCNKTLKEVWKEKEWCGWCNKKANAEAVSLADAVCQGLRPETQKKLFMNSDDSTIARSGYPLSRVWSDIGKSKACYVAYLRWRKPVGLSCLGLAALCGLGYAKASVVSLAPPVG